jgi:hypothetical protein
MKRSLCVGMAMLVLSGCATGPAQKYEWGNYETSMYDYYKNPGKPDVLIVTIEQLIKKAEARNLTVAPGLYAEYGYLLMVQGKSQDAVAYFEKEKSKWPESTQLMDRMSKMATAQPAAAGGAQ